MRAAIYARVSSGMQAEDGLSLDAQERLNRGYAREHEYMVDEAHVYREAHTGGELFERAELMRLLSAARRHEFQTVVVDCLDRWVRDDAFDGWLDTELRLVGVRVLFATETYADDFAGRLQRSMKRQFAQEERRKASQRTRKAYQERLDQQRPPAIGTPPYGYQADKQWFETKRGTIFKATGILIVDDAEAAIVRRIFRALLEGWSLRALARQLNQEGIPPPSASDSKRYAMRCSLWGVSTLAGIIRDPVYRGERAVRRQRSLAVDPEEKLNRAQRGLSGTVNTELRPRADWVLLPAPAIVSEGEWHAAQVTLNDRAGIFRTRNNEGSEKREAHPALLRGLIFCTGCGLRLSPHWQETGRLVYRCASRNTPAGACGAAGISGEEVETWVKREVAAFLQQPERIERELAKLTTAAADTDLEAELERQYRLQAAAIRKQERLLSLFAGAADGELPVAMIQQQLAAAEREKEGLEAIIMATRARQQQRSHSQEQGQQLAHYCRRVAKKLENAAFADWRMILEALGAKISAAGRKKGEAPVEWKIEAEIDPSAAEEEGLLFIARSTSRHDARFTFVLARRPEK